MAGALYRVDYAAGTGGAAVVYIGDDGVTGMDAGYGTYSGNISITDRARGKISIYYEKGGQLVTGHQVGVGQTVSFDIDFEPDFLSGKVVDINFFGVLMKARFVKISDIPIP